MEDRGPAAYIAELVGTFMLVLFIALIASVYARKGIGTPEFVTIGLLHAFVLMMLIQTLGGTSGGHFNPAVTAGLLAVRKIKPSDAAVYVVMQVIGAIAGAALCKVILSELG
jgi:glycerol uptake facilitator-like aquaporin